MNVLFVGNLLKHKMHDYGIILIRTLILVSENEIREFAKIAGFLRIMCQCPIGQNSMRKNRPADRRIAGHFLNARQNIAQAGLIYGSQANDK